MSISGRCGGEEADEEVVVVVVVSVRVVLPEAREWDNEMVVDGTGGVG